MRSLPWFLAAACLLASAPASAHGDHRVLDIVAHDDGFVFWFEVDGSSVHNPTILAQPGTEIEVHFRNNGTVAHNFHLGAPLDTGIPCCVPRGGNATFTFTMPDVAGLPYFCEPHEGLGMKGEFAPMPVSSRPSGAARGASLPGAALLFLALLLAAQAVYRGPPSARP